MTVNLIQQKYLVALANKIFSADITFFGHEVQILIILDLGTRRVPAYKIKHEPFETKDVIDLIHSIKKSFDLESPVVFHFDQQSIFKSQELINYIQSENFYLSNAEPQQHQNQCSEVLNRTLKIIFRKKLLATMDTKLKPYLKKESLGKLVNKISWEELVLLFQETVNAYNAQPHEGKRMYQASPDVMNEALNSISPNIIIPETILAPNYTKKLWLLQNSKGEVLQDYAGSWEDFFLNWRAEQLAQHERLLASNQNLEKQNEILKEQIELLVTSAKLRDQRELEEREAKAALLLEKENRKNKPKKRVRDYVSYDNFLEALELVNKEFSNTLVIHRVRITLALLYFTGLRISNLLVLTKKQVYDLLQEGEIDLKIIKRGKPRHMVCLGPKGQEFLRSLDTEIDFISKGQPDLGGPFFYSPLDPSKTINLANFDKQCNRILVKLSNNTGQHIRSHSFRATLITDLLEDGQSIEDVKDIIGHKSINTTDRYRRSVVGTKELRSIMGRVQKARLDGWKIKGTKPQLKKDEE